MLKKWSLKKSRKGTFVRRNVNPNTKVKEVSGKDFGKLWGI
jgi:hypothetical protein